jgi:hypothetical protein
VNDLSATSTSEPTNLRLVYSGEFDDRCLPKSFEIDEGGFLEPLVRVARRARTCLEGRTDLQIRFIAEFADMLVSGAVFAGRMVGVSADGTEKKIAGAELALQLDQADLITAASDILQHIVDTSDDGQFDLGFLEEDGSLICQIDALTPCDILAALALVQCVRARQFNSESWFALCGGLEHTIAATEAVVLAEGQRRGRQADGRNFKARLGEANRLAAEARWQKLEPARQRAADLYRQKEWRSRAEAARTIAPEIAEIAKRAGIRLSPQNAANTIDRWLKEAGPK